MAVHAIGRSAGLACNRSDRTIKFQTTTDPAVLERFPTIYIIGVQKAATTSLSHVLRHAHNIETSESAQAQHYDGETHYIATCSRRRACSTEGYASLWLNQSKMHAASWVDSDGDGIGDNATLKLDPTPSTFASPSAAAILLAIYPSELLPRCRLIVALREPASRMLSWYNHRRREYWMARPPLSEPRSFCARPDLFRTTQQMPALMAHAELRGERFFPSFDTTAACWLEWYSNVSSAFLRQWGLPEESSPTGMAYTNPLLTGHYASHLRRWTSTGWPRSQLLVVGFAELVDPDSDAPQRVVEFAGARGYTPPKLYDYNRGASVPAHAVSKWWGRVPPAGLASKQARMCCETWEQLSRHYAEPNNRLYEQLAADRSAGTAPPMEARLAKFEAPPCDASCTSTDAGRVASWPNLAEKAYVD